MGEVFPPVLQCMRVYVYDVAGERIVEKCNRADASHVEPNKIDILDVSFCYSAVRKLGLYNMHHLISLVCGMLK